jgi:hypothetical protein
MAQSVLLIWSSCLLVALAGAMNSLSGRRVIALAVNSVAAILTFAVFAWFNPFLVSRLVQFGGFESSVFLAPIVMWVVLVGAAGISIVADGKRGAAA